LIHTQQSGRCGTWGRSDREFKMLPSVKFKVGVLALTTGLAGGIAWGVFHRSNPVVVPSEISKKGILVSLAENKTAQTGTVLAADDSFPKPSSSATDEELLGLARTAVARSAQHAIEWARSQSDSELRRRLLSAVLRAWGESDPDAAVDWVLTQDMDERRADMEAALAGAVKQPQLALAIVRQLLVYDPQDAAACGPAFIVALSNAGQFQTALEFLNSAPADSRTDWTAATFQRWGQNQPQDAVKALDSITDEALHSAAFRAVVDGWSAGDPAALAAYANSLPAGESRDYAVNQAFDNWSMQDPAGMAAWLSAQPPGTEFDKGVALMISKTDSANVSPEDAMGWVEGISDPTLKLNSFMRVLGEWNQNNPAAAQQYAANASWLDGQRRQEILKNLQTPPSTTAVAAGD
jgi:hypothetical protein